jgi:hypothetical protein
VSEPRWMSPGLPGVVDPVDETGTIQGFVAQIASGVRGYVIAPRRGHRGPFSSITEHLTDEAARAHVEAEVARIYGGGSAA